MASDRFEALAAALEAEDAAAFVHVGDRYDADFSYLSRTRAESSAAFVYHDGEACLCPARGDVREAREGFDGDVYGPEAFTVETPGERAAALLDARDTGAAVSTPKAVPHDAARYLERAGYEVTATDAVEEARAVKTEREMAAIRDAQAAAAAGVRRAEALLAEAAVENGELHSDGDALTAERLRREANAAIARAGASDAGNTRARVGAAETDDGDAVRVGETVVVSVAPRSAGYHGRLARTFVRDTEGGWDRRAYLAVERARDAAFGEMVAGARAGDVHVEAAAEVRAYGFPTDPTLDEGFAGATGSGIGLRRRERPVLTGDTTLAAGQVLAVGPSVRDPAEGRVELADAVVVTADGYEVLEPYPTAITPAKR